MKRIIRIGQQTGDLTGNGELVIQSAIDYLSYLGGGIVKINAGVYDIESSVHLRSNVRIEGVPGETVFRKCDNISSPLWTDGDMNQRQITLVNADGFEPGHTITVRIPERGTGFHETVAVITEKEGNVLYLDRPLTQDFSINEQVVAERNFPVIMAYDCENNHISGITIEGNKDNNSLVGGCRNAGIFFFACKNMVIENCSVMRYNGDGISYQVCENIDVLNCECAENSGLGLHPGSGTTGTRVIGCKSYGNGGDGIFVCWRVTRGEITDCVIENNGSSGISIGHKDIHNIIRNNRICGNAMCGIFFRNEREPMGANHNLVENNVIIDNGSAEHGYTGIRIRGFTNNVKFLRNRIVYNADSGVGDKSIGILQEENAYDNVFEGNELVNCG